MTAPKRKFTLLVGLLLALVPMIANADETPFGAAPSGTVTPEVAAARWDEIKNSTFEQRDRYLTGLKTIVRMVESQIEDLSAKRSFMSNRSETVDWDLVMKEFLTAHDYLRSLTRDATKATVDEWEQTKEKIAQAWTSTQSAYAKVLAASPR